MSVRKRHISTRPADEPIHTIPTGMDFEKRNLYIAPKSIMAHQIADGALDYGLSFYAQVTTAVSTTHFKAAGLAGKGAGFFIPASGTPYEIYVVQADAAAPEGEMLPVVAYDTSDGDFQHAEFGAQLALGDIVLIIHPLLASLGTKATAAAADAVTTNDFLMAYVKQIVTLLLDGTYGLSALETLVDTLEAALGNATGDMSAVTQGDSSTLAAYIKRLRAHTRGHNQSRICLVVPDLANLASDAPNTAIKAELDKIGTVSVLDEASVDGGVECWGFYDLIVIGSDTYAGFTNSNLDDLISVKIPLIVCNSAVAEHMKMGTDTTQSASTVNEWCKTIGNRMMYLIFGSTGDKAIFSEATVSDRLDMSDVSLTEHLLMTSLTGDTNTTAVVASLPMESGTGALYTLNDATEMPAGRLFAGCFVNADKLTALGTLLLRRMARNFIQIAVTPSISLKANASLISKIHTDTNELQTDWTNGGRLDNLLDAIPTSIVPVSTDWKGNFNWDTSAYTTVEQDISALFSTNLAIATRRKYSVKLDLTNVEADGSFVSLYLSVKEKIDGTNYRAIDRKTVLKADIGALAEPGIIIDIPATSENIQITMLMDVALAGDATIYYAVVKEHLE